MLEYLAIIFTAILANNIVFAQFLGICPFIGVSKNMSSAFGMGMAVTFVMAVATAVTWLLQHFVLAPLGLVYVQTIAFILVIAVLVQMLEIVMKKTSPALYAALGVFLPLITTNCAVLGVAIIVAQKDFGFLHSLVYTVATALGFAMALALMAGIRMQLELLRCSPLHARCSHCPDHRRHPGYGLHGLCRHKFLIYPMLHRDERERSACLIFS